ncbi:MAG: hypothetical protein ACI4OH_09185 [Mitsuokella sp.]
MSGRLLAGPPLFMQLFDQLAEFVREAVHGALEVRRQPDVDFA